LQDAGVQVAIDFPSNTYEWSATINLVCRISCCFWPLTRSGKDSQMIQCKTATRTYLELHGLFRLLNTSPRAVCVTWLWAFFHYWASTILSLCRMAEEPMALTCLTGNPCITLPAGIAAAPQALLIGGKLYSEATITFRQ
jgi:hypothetical protein